ncbi:ABC transporter permease subunit, partial [Nocardioides pyridinolyticus]
RVAGVLVGASVGAISVGMSTALGLKGLVILIVAGSRSIPGAAIIGILLGVLEVLTIDVLGASYRDAIAFVVLFAALVIRPSGVFGSPSEVR